jgi:hypothetical protein
MGGHKEPMGGGSAGLGQCPMGTRLASHERNAEETNIKSIMDRKLSIIKPVSGKMRTAWGHGKCLFLSSSQI